MTYVRFKDERMSDLIGVCKSCHEAIHAWHKRWGGDLQAATLAYVRDYAPTKQTPKVKAKPPAKTKKAAKQPVKTPTAAGTGKRRKRKKPNASEAGKPAAERARGTADAPQRYHGALDGLIQVQRRPLPVSNKAKQKAAKIAARDAAYSAIRKRQEEYLKSIGGS
jgi:hypothetical protein